MQMICHLFHHIHIYGLRNDFKCSQVCEWIKSICSILFDRCIYLEIVLFFLNCRLLYMMQKPNQKKKAAWNRFGRNLFFHHSVSIIFLISWRWKKKSFENMFLNFEISKLRRTVRHQYYLVRFQRKNCVDNLIQKTFKKW
jgi:hypothetical protein